MKIKALFICLCFASALLAQERSAAVEQRVSELTQQYQLNEEQVAELYVIQEREARNLNEIAVLQQSNYREFLQRRATIRRHSAGSLRRMLTTEQRRIQDQERTELRVANSEFIKQMQAEGKPKEEIELLLLERS
ncbi:MAG: hypothetical protein AAGJ82_11290 [Bacteroidota bacterium]